LIVLVNSFSSVQLRALNDLSLKRYCTATETETETTNSNNNTTTTNTTTSLYKSEGLFAVDKPLNWTSQDVVSYVRKMFERDCRERGLQVAKLKKRGNKNKMVKVGHGGTLDPLATGVLVIGVGKGTKLLQEYLNGPKQYTAWSELGFETNTLDMEGEVIRTAPYDHVTRKAIENVLPSFRGRIQQVPPIYSALKRDGKPMYQRAREAQAKAQAKGETKNGEVDLKLEAREVRVYALDLLSQEDEVDNDNDSDNDSSTITNSNSEVCVVNKVFGVNVECGGGTYVRSLIRDIGRALGSAATMTSLQRTQQGPFRIQHVLPWEDLNPDNIYQAIDRSNEEILN